MDPMLFDTIIIGGGPAGLSAAIYAVRKSLKVLLVTKNIGGQAALSGDIENYLGFSLISGAELAAKFREDIEKFKDDGITLKEGEEVTSLEGRDPDFIVKTDQGNIYHGKTVIIASGRIPRMLNVPGEKEFLGKGVATCATCLPPGESIIANSSISKIENIEEGQRVLTHNGTYKDVERTMETTFEGDLVKITTRFFTEPVLLTPNHPVLKCNLKKGSGANYWNFNWSSPEWVQAGSLKKDDIVFYPVISENKLLRSILISDYLDLRVDPEGNARNRRETYTAHPIPNKIPLSNDFLRLVGYFLAEGCITSRGINLYFNKKEMTYTEDVCRLVQKVFHLEPTVKYENNVARIMVFSKIIKDFFELLFGKYSYNKKLPHLMVTLDKNKQKEIVKGFFRGDGCVRKKDFCLVTNSRTLTYQLRDILLRLGIIPSLEIRKLEKLHSTQIAGRTVNFTHDKYHLTIGGASLEAMSAVLEVEHPKLKKRKRTNSSAWIKDGQVLLPIRRIESQAYSGPVLNFAVQDNNTYVAKNFIVHNCDGPLFKNKDVAIIGGGNSALDAAFSLMKVASSVTIVNLTPDVRGDEVLIKNVKASPLVKILNSHQVLAVQGEQFVTGIKVQDLNTKEEKILPVSGMFIEIGWTPSTRFDNLSHKNSMGEIMVDEFGETSIPGLYSAGDVNDLWGEQIIIAAGEGAKVALKVAEHLAKTPHGATSNPHEQ